MFLNVEPHGLTPVVPLFSSRRDVCAATSRAECHSSTPLQTRRSVGGVKKSIGACGMCLLLLVLAGPVGTSDAKELIPGARALSHEMILKRKLIVDRAIREAQGYISNRQIEKAIYHLEQAMEFAPYDFRPYALSAQLYLRQGKLSQALKVMEKAGRTRTNDDLIFDNFQIYQKAEKSQPSPDAGKIFIASFKDNKKCAFSFQFDDGARDVYEQILPVFDKFGFTATVGINPGLTDRKRDPKLWGDWSHWNDAARRGFEIANHGATHKHLKDLSDQALEYEINGAYDLIVQRIGIPPTSFIFPFDYADEKSIGKVQERHLALRDHEALDSVYPYVFIPVYGGGKFSVETAQKIIELAISNHLWVIAECHTIFRDEIKTYKPISMEFLMEHLSDIKENEEDVWVDTFHHIYQYLRERKESRLQINSLTADSASFVVSNTLDPEKYSFPLTVIVNVFPATPREVVAYRENNGKKELLETKNKGSLIHVNVLPHETPVLMRWK